MNSYVLTVVCTDRGQHPWTLLGDLTGSGGLLRANVGSVHGQRAQREVASSLSLDDIRRPHYRVQARCPRCKRNLQWKGERAVEVMNTLQAAGVSSLDISALPT